MDAKLVRTKTKYDEVRMLHSDTMAEVAIEKPRYMRRFYFVHRRIESSTDAGILPTPRDLALKKLIISKLDELYSREAAIKSALRYRSGKLALMRSISGQRDDPPTPHDDASDSDDGMQRDDKSNSDSRASGHVSA